MALRTALLALLALALPVRGGDLHLTYLGNEGFLLESDGRKVLIDALVSQDSHKAYVDQSEDTARSLRRADAPYDGVDLVLATHVHGDHFHPLEVGLHLAANPEAVFVSTEQAVGELKREFGGFEQIASRVRAVAPAEGEAVEMPELGLTVFAMHHGRDLREPIQNNGYLVEIGGHRVLHMGDTEATAEELAALELPARDIDVGLIPSWYLDAEPWVGAIEEAVKPRISVVMHLAPRWHEEAATHNQSQSRRRVKRIRAAYPDAIVFEEYGQKEIFAAKLE